MQTTKIIALSIVFYSLSLSAHPETFTEKLDAALGFKPMAILANFIAQTRQNFSLVSYYGSASTNSYVALQLHTKMRTCLKK